MKPPIEGVVWLAETGGNFRGNRFLLFLRQKVSLGTYLFRRTVEMFLRCYRLPTSFFRDKSRQDAAPIPQTTSIVEGKTLAFLGQAPPLRTKLPKEYSH